MLRTPSYVNCASSHVFPEVESYKKENSVTLLLYVLMCAKHNFPKAQYCAC